MLSYILRRLLLIVPTLFGILLINFIIIQAAPGGPVEQMIAKLEGFDAASGGATGRISGGGGEVAVAGSQYRGAQGLDPELVKEIERMYGFDKSAPERFMIMLKNYLHLDFGQSFFRDAKVTDLIIEKLPVSISLGLWSTLIMYLVSIPLGIAKAVRHGSVFDIWTSSAIIVGYAIPAFLFAILLVVLFAGGSYWDWFPLRGLTSNNFDQLSLGGKVLDYFWHLALPVTALVIGNFATITLLTKNSFLDEMFVGSLGAELIANDKPLVVHYDGGWYFPVFKRYPETTFGGEFPLEANYKSPYISQLIAEKDGWVLWPPIPYSYDTINYELKVPAPAPPSAENWLGTDDQARDVLARVIYGFRVSILFALTLTVLSSLIGVTVGALQGYYGGWVDLLGQRFLEVWSGLPVLYLLIILASFVQPNFWWLLGIMLLFSWMSLVDVVRAEFLRGRNLEYVRAARALGMRNSAIMFRHILPNAMISTLTFMPFILTGAIGTLTSLDFLGFGLPPGAPSLGELVAQGKSNLQAPWLGISAFVVLAVMLSLLVFIGEAARDAFDPRK